MLSASMKHDYRERKGNSSQQMIARVIFVTVVRSPTPPILWTNHGKSSCESSDICWIKYCVFNYMGNCKKNLIEALVEKYFK